MDVTTCSLSPLNIALADCNLTKKDNNCKLVDLINQESCIGAAVYKINSNFNILSNFITSLGNNVDSIKNILLTVETLHEKWEKAYTLTCSLSSSWNELYDVATYVDSYKKVPVVVFYHQIYDTDVWDNLSPSQKTNEINGPISKWVNDMYPAQTYCHDATLTCYILFSKLKNINVADGGSGICPIGDIIIDKYIKTNITVNYKINNPNLPQWEVY